MQFERKLEFALVFGAAFAFLIQTGLPMLGVESKIFGWILVSGGIACLVVALTVFLIPSPSTTTVAQPSLLLPPGIVLPRRHSIWRQWRRRGLWVIAFVIAYVILVLADRWAILQILVGGFALMLVFTILALLLIGLVKSVLDIARR